MLTPIIRTLVQRTSNLRDSIVLKINLPEFRGSESLSYFEDY